MLMQALFTRGGQPIPMRVDKFDYLFTENHTGDFVCNVISDDHAQHMLSTGNFKEYVPPTREELQEREQVRLKEKSNIQTNPKAKIKGK